MYTMEQMNDGKEGQRGNVWKPKNTEISRQPKVRYLSIFQFSQIK